MTNSCRDELDKHRPSGSWSLGTNLGVKSSEVKAEERSSGEEVRA